MKNLTKFLIVLAISSLSIIACDEEVIVEDPTLEPNGLALEQKIAEHRNNAKEHFNVDLSSTAGTTITSENGTIITFYYGSVKDADNNLVSGIIEVSLLEIFDKSDMVLMNKTTMGLLPDGNHQALKSGGQFLLEASQGGEELYINGNLKVMVPVSNTGIADPDMTLYANEWGEDDDCDLITCPDDVWEEVEDTSLWGQGTVLALENAAGVTYYSCFVQNFGWSNIDRFMADPSPKTMIKVKTPEEYNNTNCAVYVSFDGQEYSLAALDVYLEDLQVYSEHYGQVPIGSNIHVIAVSIVEDQYYSSFKAVSVEADMTIEMDELTETSEASLIAEINALP